MKTCAITTVTEILFPNRVSGFVLDRPKTERELTLSAMVDLTSRRHEERSVVAQMFETNGNPSDALVHYLAYEGLAEFKRNYFKHFVEWDQPMPLDWMNDSLYGAWIADVRRQYDGHGETERVPGLRFELDRDALLFMLFYSDAK